LKAEIKAMAWPRACECRLLALSTHCATSYGTGCRNRVGRSVFKAGDTFPSSGFSGSALRIEHNSFERFDGVSGLWLKLGRGLVAPKARGDKTRGMTTPDEIASESKKA
jgi:hypothetical protein